MAEPALQLSLRYIGSEVDDGTMSLDEVADALSGFAGAYYKTAQMLAPEAELQLRISAVRQGSLVLDIIAISREPFVASIVKSTGELAAKWTFDRFREYIDAKKLAKNRPYTVEINGNNNTVLVASDGATMNINRDTLRLLEGKTLDLDLGRIASPLSEGYVDSLEVASTDAQGTQQTSIDSDEKQYFASSSGNEESQPVKLDGTPISYNKENHRGTFRLKNGKRVPYRVTGAKADTFAARDFAHSGLLRVEGTGYFDDSLVLLRIEIDRATRLQQELPIIPDAPSDVA